MPQLPAVRITSQLLTVAALLILVKSFQKPDIVGAMAGPRLQSPRVGETAPDFTLEAADGATVNLHRFPKPVVLVFLRHLT